MPLANRKAPLARDAKPALFEVRPLTTDDIAVLKQGRGQKATIVQQLRDSHHLLARLIASGVRLQEAAETSGYSLGSVYRYNADPAFQELVATYRQEVAVSHRETIDEYNRILIANRMKAERQIADRLDDEEAAISTRDLITITRDAADRTGYGKRSTQDHKHSFAGEMESVWARSGAAKLIDGSPGLAPSAPAALPSTPAPTEPASRPTILAPAPSRRGL